MITIKLPYNCENIEFQSLLRDLRKQQSCAIRVAYNRFKDGFKLKDVNNYIKNLKGIDKLSSWYLYSATSEAKTLFSLRMFFSPWTR